MQLIEGPEAAGQSNALRRERGHECLIQSHRQQGPSGTQQKLASQRFLALASMPAILSLRSSALAYSSESFQP